MRHVKEQFLSLFGLFIKVRDLRMPSDGQLVLELMQIRLVRSLVELQKLFGEYLNV